MQRKWENEGAWRRPSSEREICIILGELLRATETGRRKKDRYRQKVEDVFSGQEPRAKISRDVNSWALPVCRPARDTEVHETKWNETCKNKGRRWRKRSYMSSAAVMFSFNPYFFFNRPPPGEQRHPRRHKKKGKPRPPHTTVHRGEARALDAKPSTQSPHMLLWPPVKLWYGSNLHLNPPSAPTIISRHLLLLLFRGSLSFAALMTRLELARREDPRVTADDRDGKPTSALTKCDEESRNFTLKLCRSVLVFSIVDGWRRRRR